MKIKRLSLKNIRSYEDEVIDFPDGSLLLAGNVGSGKSSILLAIEYALFGLQPGQRGSSLLRNNSESGFVSLEIEVSGKQIIIERKLKRGQKGISNEYAAITIDGVKTESSITEIKTKILQSLGYPAEFIKKNNLLFRYTVFTPQEQMKEIILGDVETRINLIRQIFGIDKYKRVKENVSILLNNLKSEIKLLQIEISHLEKDKNTLSEKREQINNLNKKTNNTKKSLDEKISEKNEVKNKLLELEDKQKGKYLLEKEMGETSVLINTKKESLTSKITEINEIKKMLSQETKFDEPLYNLTLEKIESSESYIDNLNNQNIELISKINSLKELMDTEIKKRQRVFKIKFCPTCLQEVSETHKHNISKETESSISKTRREITSLSESFNELSKIISSEKQKLSDLIKQKSNMEIERAKSGYLEKSKEKLSLLENSLVETEKDINFLENHNVKLKQDLLLLSKYDVQIKKTQELLKTHEESQRNLEISLAGLRKEIEITNKEIKVLSEKVAETEKTRKRLNNLMELQDWLSTKFLSLVDFIERNILMNIRIEFSNLFKKWFSSLVSQDSLSVELDDSFSPIILQGDIEMDYSFLSGGERTAIALAYRLALNQTINSTFSKIQTKDIVILDEPTDGFSESQIDQMRSILNDLSVLQLIIVSHEQKVESFVDNIIRISKQEDVSKVDSTQISHTFKKQHV